MRTIKNIIARLFVASVFMLVVSTVVAVCMVAIGVPDTFGASCVALAGSVAWVAGVVS